MHYKDVVVFTVKHGFVLIYRLLYSHTPVSLRAINQHMNRKHKMNKRYLGFICVKITIKWGNIISLDAVLFLFIKVTVSVWFNYHYSGC